MLFALLCCGNAMANTSSEMKPYNIGTPNLDLGNANLGNWEQYLGGYYLDAEDSTYKYTEWEEVTETDRIALINGTKDPVISCWDFPTSPDDRITVRVGSYNVAENNNEREKAAAERLVYRFKVTEDMGALLYRYAPVLHLGEQPTIPGALLHTDEQNPTITVSVSLYDTLTGESEVLPNSVSIASKDELERPAEGSTCRSSITRDITEFAYHTWTDKKIDLSEYIGKVLKIEVINHDCLRVSSDGKIGPGGHRSYGYFCAEVIPAKPVVANYLTFTAEESGSSFSLINTKEEEPNLEYSSDGGNTWATLHANEQVTFTNVGDSVMLRGINPNGFSGFPEPAYFTMKGRIAASGSVMSLIDGEGISTTIPHQECFCYLFQNCTSLTQAPELPATDVTQSCYRFMFKGCTNLKQAPELPATVLDYACYYEMFKGCTSLTQAPQLPATELKDGCYSYMFENCTGLTQAPELPATTLEDSCYMNMFSGCTSLTRAPELPATELIRYCYMNMFNGCTNLNYIKVGITTLDSDKTDATNNWVKGVDNKGTFIFPCGSTYNKHGLSEVPNNFTIISSPIVIFQNPDETELWRDTIECGSVPEYRGVTPTLGEDKYVFYRWNMELEALEEPGIYYYTAQYAIQLSNPDDNSADNCTVWTEGLTIFVGDAQGSVKVYNLNGQLIHSVEGETSVSHAITMPAHGVYIVKIGKNSIKVEL